MIVSAQGVERNEKLGRSGDAVEVRGMHAHGVRKASHGLQSRQERLLGPLQSEFDSITTLLFT